MASMRAILAGLPGWFWPCTVVFFAAWGRLLALGPHEVAVLVNTNSDASRRVAQAFVAGRHVPEQNVVGLDVPVPRKDGPASISPGEFMSRIWIPSLKTLRDRGVGNHILAWVYSVDFPVEVGTSPAMSITGFTFARGRDPGHDAIDRATYVSSLFGGPEQEGGAILSPQTFGRFRDWLGEEMPAPAMMLGFTGRNGNTEEQVVRCLKTGISSDGTAPTGTVFFVTSDDVRSVCRMWQFRQVQQALLRTGVHSTVTDKMPDASQSVLGLLMGADTANPAGLHLVPGSMAEHLTSAAGIFHSDNQTKLSAWIAAGATASSGTVVEPFANWRKFPSASFFVYYTGGCTMMESFYQSVRCPLQILLIGDPLARPWGEKGTVCMTELPSGVFRGKVRLSASGRSANGIRASRVDYLVDGRTIGSGDSVEWDTTGVVDGSHLIRIVAFGRGGAPSQWFSEQAVHVRNGTGR